MYKSPNMFDWHTAYFQRGDPSLRPTYATMAVLAAYANFDDRTCYPSQRTLAEKLGYKKADTIRLHIKTNIEAGWLRKIREGNSYSQTNKYEFVIPTPPVEGGSLEDRAATHSPREKGELGQLPPQNGGNSPREKGVTPPADRVLTTKGTTERTTERSSSLGARNPSDPFFGSGDIPSREHNDSGRTPPVERGSAPPTHGGTTSAVIRWPSGKPFVPGQFDPFAAYVDETTGEPITPTPA